MVGSWYVALEDDTLDHQHCKLYFNFEAECWVFQNGPFGTGEGLYGAKVWCLKEEVHKWCKLDAQYRYELKHKTEKFSLGKRNKKSKGVRACDCAS